MKSFLTVIAISLSAAFATQPAWADATIATVQVGTGNKFYVNQFDPGAGYVVDARITQIGNNNTAGDPVAKTAGIIQTGFNDSGYSEIWQNGNGNKAGIRQHETARTSDLIRQLGNNNTGSIVQDGWQVGASINQTGVGNTSAIVQTGIVDFEAHTIQIGTNNNITVNQNIAGHQGADVRQNGASNSASVVQLRLDFVEANINQTGALNTVRSNQTDAMFTGATLTQIGNANTVLNTQSGEWNQVNSLQTGLGNTASFTQSLNESEASITQLGNANKATIKQTGVVGVSPAANVASIQQTGNNFVATLTQTGSGNLAGIVQH